MLCEMFHAITTGAKTAVVTLSRLKAAYGLRYLNLVHLPKQRSAKYHNLSRLIFMSFLANYEVGCPICASRPLTAVAQALCATGKRFERDIVKLQTRGCQNHFPGKGLLKGKCFFWEGLVIFYKLAREIRLLFVWLTLKSNKFLH